MLKTNAHSRDQHLNEVISGVVRLETFSEMLLPLYNSAVQAGFPSPADDYLEETLDLRERLVKHPTATFLVKVRGDSVAKA